MGYSGRHAAATPPVAPLNVITWVEQRLLKDVLAVYHERRAQSNVALWSLCPASSVCVA